MRNNGCIQCSPRNTFLSWFKKKANENICHNENERRATAWRTREWETNKKNVLTHPFVVPRAFTLFSIGERERAKYEEKNKIKSFINRNFTQGSCSLYGQCSLENATYPWTRYFSIYRMWIYEYRHSGKHTQKQQQQQQKHRKQRNGQNRQPNVM